MNNIMIAGHLGADPEVRFTSSGKKVTTLRVASNTRKGATEDTIWWRVTIWGEQFDKLVSYLKKGSAVMVHGDFQKPELFADREGKQQISLNITAFHIQFSPFGKTERSSEGSGHEGAAPAASAPAAAPNYGSPREAVNPYLSQGVQKGQSSPMQVPGGTFDDEVPF